MTFKIRERACFSSLQISSVSQDTRRRTDCRHNLILCHKSIHLLHQCLTCLQIRRARHTARKHDHIQAAKLYLAKQRIHRHCNRMGTRHAPLFGDRCHRCLHPCPAQNINHRQCLDLFISCSKKNCRFTHSLFPPFSLF